MAACRRLRPSDKGGMAASGITGVTQNQAIVWGEIPF